MPSGLSSMSFLLGKRVEKGRRQKINMSAPTVITLSPHYQIKKSIRGLAVCTH